MSGEAFIFAGGAVILLGMIVDELRAIRKALTQHSLQNRGGLHD